MVDFFGLYLEGSAHLWWRASQGTLKTWDAVVTAFKKAFVPQADRYFPELALHQYVYQSGQKPVDYYFQKVQLCRAFDKDMATASIVRHVLRGLPSSCQQALTARSDLTEDNLLEAVISVLDSYERGYVASVEMETLQNVLQTAMEARFDRLTTELRQSLQVGKVDPTPESVMSPTMENVGGATGAGYSCQVCGKNGHTAKFCWGLQRFVETSQYHQRRSFYRDPTQQQGGRPQYEAPRGQGPRSKAPQSFPPQRQGFATVAAVPTHRANRGAGGRGRARPNPQEQGNF